METLTSKNVEKAAEVYQSLPERTGITPEGKWLVDGMASWILKNGGTQVEDSKRIGSLLAERPEGGLEESWHDEEELKSRLIEEQRQKIVELEREKQEDQGHLDELQAKVVSLANHKFRLQDERSNLICDLNTERRKWQGELVWDKVSKRGPMIVVDRSPDSFGRVKVYAGGSEPHKVSQGGFWVWPQTLTAVNPKEADCERRRLRWAQRQETMRRVLWWTSMGSLLASTAILPALLFSL